MKGYAKHHRLESQQLTRRRFMGGMALAAGAALTRNIAVGADAEAEKPRYQIGCYTRPWDQFEYRVALDGIAEAGFQYAGLITAKGKTWLMNHGFSPVGRYQCDVSRRTASKNDARESTGTSCMAI